ncbi:LOW QUALITY PROTEIN: matrix metalloproteinase-25 [Rhinophrynus dorsalis]
MLLRTWMLFGSLVIVRGSPTARDISKGVDWLTRYGYLPPDPYSAQQQTLEGLREAVRTMQRFAGLRVTGDLDDETVSMMQKPRCSLPDVIQRPNMYSHRRRRFALSGTVWDKLELTWRIDSFPTAFTQGQTRSLITDALNVWSQETQIRFVETSGEPDIRVGFVGGSHGDGYPFDGQGGTLGHAFFPGVGSSAGDAHLDADEMWTYNEDQGTDLFAVAVHEFGHSLGLSHSSSEESIMKPYYQGSVGEARKYRLPADDVQGIRALYGAPIPGVRPPPVFPTRTFIPPRRPTNQPRLPFPDRCSTNFDAIANIRGEVFFFKNKYFWRVQSSRQLVSLNPAHINRFWLGLPPDLPKVDAVYERNNDSKIVFIAGGRYWVFKDTLAEPGYPRPLSDFGMNTDGVDAAFVWKHNSKTYFFRRNVFWRFDEKSGRLDPNYPKDSSLWQGVPTQVDDVISWENGETYFFKGSQYWKFQGGKMETEPGYPRSTALNWMYCPSTDPAAPTDVPEGRDQRDCNCNCAVEKNTGGKSASHTHLWVALVLPLLLPRL